MCLVLGGVKGLIPRQILRCCVVFKAKGGRLVSTT